MLKSRILFLVWVVFLIALLGSLSMGPVSLSFSHLSSTDKLILFQLRLPRSLSAFVVGGGLALSGAIFQGLFRNPLADSYLLGISSGASLGAAIAIVLGIVSPLAHLGSVTIMAFLGALLALGLVFYFASVHGYLSTFRLLLAGLGISLFFSSLVAALMIVAEEQLKPLIFFFLGGFASSSWDSALLSLLCIPPVALIASYFSPELNLLLLGEETAASSGLSVKRVEIMYAVMAAFLTSISVSVAGLIGFVGLIVPHILRMVSGADQRVLLPLSFFVGGVFLLLCDTLARVVLSPIELPVGVITSLFGVPFFLYLLKKEKGEVML